MKKLLLEKSQSTTSKSCTESHSLATITPVSSAPSSPLIKAEALFNEKQKDDYFINIMPFTILCTISLIFLGPIYIPNIYSLFLFLTFAFTTLLSSFHLFKFMKTTYRIKEAIQKGLRKEKIDGLMHNARFYHIIIIPNYKEPDALLINTLDVLAQHSQSSHRYIVILAMEESEQDAEKKIQRLTLGYDSKFKHIFGCIHPANILNEARGKGSNVNYAARWITKKLIGLNFRIDECILTIGDSDSHYNELYFDCLEEKMSDSNPERFQQVFCPPIFLGRNAHRGSYPFPIIIHYFCLRSFYI